MHQECLQVRDKTLTVRDVPQNLLDVLWNGLHEVVHIEVPSQNFEQLRWPRDILHWKKY